MLGCWLSSEWDNVSGFSFLWFYFLRFWFHFLWFNCLSLRLFWFHLLWLRLDFLRLGLDFLWLRLWLWQSHFLLPLPGILTLPSGRLHLGLRLDLLVDRLSGHTLRLGTALRPWHSSLRFGDSFERHSIWSRQRLRGGEPSVELELGLQRSPITIDSKNDSLLPSRIHSHSVGLIVFPALRQ